MAKIKIEDLKKFIKQTKLVVENMEDDSSDTSKMVKLTLVEEYSALGSNTTDKGADMRFKSKSVLVFGDINGDAPGIEQSDFSKFLEGCEDVNGVLHYSGAMKVDVSKPKVRFVQGEPVVTPPRLWLTSTAFNRRGGTLQKEKQGALSNVLADFFGDGTSDAGKKDDLVAPVAKKIEPVNGPAKVGG